ncbi:CopG family transcriptional regulator [Shewanella sp. OMA3-2]|uniref:CopG family transcriptional regulator n=1 Tax=Shewanella sp. OMA3-2 TaxID=2908650 RepID=UPI001F3874A7|nr:CopG family transcriptional regulator [Shewanella sp. OMA3-2]UJF21359.1 CopG family transcriptional regulator [Shewanella sp. OMA3-2]
MSIEEFIDTANLYALGQTHEFTQSNNVVDFLQCRDNKRAITALSIPTEPVNLASKQPFRRATFTLSEQAISQLAQCSQASQIAKSKLIRHLIAEHNLLSDEDKQHIYQKLALETQLNSIPT